MNAADSTKRVLRAESEARMLRAEVEDWRTSMREVMDEACDDGAVHCTCVPFLRMEVQRLRAVLTEVTYSPCPRRVAQDGLRDLGAAS